MPSLGAVENLEEQSQRSNSHKTRWGLAWDKEETS
jgi:hypothetical protein